jgi:hypothetical protein
MEPSNCLNTPATPRRQSHRRPYGSYKLALEQRAVAGVRAAEANGWSTKQAAGLFTVCQPYLDLVKHLSEDDRGRLARGELTLRQLYLQYRQQLAERRAQRLAAEREAREQAEREAQTREIDSLIDRVGIDRIVDRFVDRFGCERATDVLDKLTQPQLSLVAAE